MVYQTMDSSDALDFTKNSKRFVFNESIKKYKENTNRMQLPMYNVPIRLTYCESAE